jgi:hypothetical protein
VGQPAAKKNGVNALASSSCSDAVDGGSSQAAATLGAQNGTQSLATITTDDLGSGIVINGFRVGEALVTEGTPVRFPNSGIPIPGDFQPPVTITVNSNPTFGFSNGYIPGYSLQVSQAIGFLHETGHAAVINGLPSVVTHDTSGVDPLTGASLSLQNDFAVGDACFPQGDFGGNQGSVGQDPGAVSAVTGARKHF